MNKYDVSIYKDAPAVAVLPLCNFGGVEILDANVEEVVSAFNFGNGREHINRTKVIYTASGKAYFKRYNRRYYLDQFCRV